MEQPLAADVGAQCSDVLPTAGPDLPSLNGDLVEPIGIGFGEPAKDVSSAPRSHGGELLVDGGNSNTLSLELALEAAAGFAAASKSRSTVECYRRDFGDFAAWCRTNRLESLPATSDVVAAYLGALAVSGRRVSTIMRRTAAIAFAHKLAGHETPTRSEPVKAVLQGIRRELGIAPDRKAPVTMSALLELLERVPPSMGGRRDRALLSIGFAAALRRSELCALTVPDLEFRREGVIVGIPRSKTDQEGEGQFVAVPNGLKLKPVRALREWLEVAGISDGPVFRAVNKGGRVVGEALEPGTVARIVKRYAGAAGFDLDEFAGHSLRAGFVTEALEQGADLLSIVRVTRHASIRTLQAYDRRAQLFRNHAGASFL